MADLLFKILIAVTPVLVFLAVLLHLDSHKLIGHHRLVQIFGLGVLAALAAWWINGLVLEWWPYSRADFSRYAAPVIEELLKAMILIWLFRSNRVGFLVDAAILGFTVGAGFSLAENVYYLWHQHEVHYGIWLVRGFGTAVMHGGSAALFAVLAQILTERHRSLNPVWYLPGLLVAITLHSAFNHFPVSPILSTVVTLLILPSLLFLVVERNEVSVHNFLEQDFNRHRRLMNQLNGGPVSDCETGRFLADLEKVFLPPLHKHLHNYIYLHTELVLSAESVLLARETGEIIQVGPDVRDKIVLLHRLEREIGKAGMHTLKPHLQLSRHEFWIIHMYEDEMPEMV